MGFPILVRRHLCIESGPWRVTLLEPLSAGLPHNLAGSSKPWMDLKARQEWVQMCPDLSQWLNGRLALSWPGVGLKIDQVNYTWEWRRQEGSVSTATCAGADWQCSPGGLEWLVGGGVGVVWLQHWPRPREMLLKGGAAHAVCGWVVTARAHIWCRECSIRAMNQCSATSDVINWCTPPNNVQFVSIKVGTNTSLFRNHSHVCIRSSEPKTDILYDPYRLCFFWEPTMVHKCRHSKYIHHPVPKVPK